MDLVHKTIDLHILIAANKDESEEGESIRDSTDEPMDILRTKNPKLYDEICKISAKLYKLYE